MEEPGAVGDTDLVLVMEDDVYAIIEFKYEKDPTNVKPALERLAQNALKAIRLKEYDRRYRLEGKRVVTVGVGVCGRGRTKVLFGDDYRP